MEGFRKRYIFALCSTALLAVLALGNSTITAMIMDTVFSPLQESGVVTEQVFQHLIFLVALLIGFTLFRTRTCRSRTRISSPKPAPAT